MKLFILYDNRSVVTKYKLEISPTIVIGDVAELVTPGTPLLLTLDKKKWLDRTKTVQSYGIQASIVLTH